MKQFIIKEMFIGNEDISGVQAISFVQDPAIETPFEYFASKKRILRRPSDMRSSDLELKFKWILGGDNNCPICERYSMQAPMYLSDWIQLALPRVKQGGTVMGIPVGNGDGSPGPYNTYCERNCNCYLEQVEELSKETMIQFKVENFEKRIVKGLVLKSNQMIYRNDVDGEGNSGYVYFSRQTVRQMKDKYGYNRKITFQHQEDRTGDAIMLDSYLEEDDKTNETKWFVSYKIIGDSLWEVIKTKKVIGFSLEAILHIR